MSDLFELPESPLPPLEAARRRLAKLEADYERCKHAVGELGPTRWDVICAKNEVERLEQEALRK